MYPDPKRVRDNRYTIRLDDYEQAVIEAVANYRGEAVSTLLRAMIVAEAAQVIAELAVCGDGVDSLLHGATIAAQAA